LSTTPLNWRRNLYAVTAAGFIGFTGFTLVMPFLPLYFEQLGVSDVGDIALWSGVSLGITPAITAMMAPFWGRFADRYGRKIMVQRSLASFVFVMAGMAYVTAPWQVFGLRALQGLFAGYGALTLTMAADLAPAGQTAYAIGFVQTAQRIGPALGPVIGGIVAQAVGLRNGFLVTASFYLVAVLVVTFGYDERGVLKHVAAKRDERVTFRNLLAFENFLLLMGVIFGLQFADRSLGPILPLFVSGLGTEASRVPLLAGVLFSVSAGAGSIGHHLAGALMSRRGARRVIAWTCGLAGAAVGGFLLAGSAWWLALPTAIFGISIGVSTTCAYTAASSIIPSGARGAGFGLLTTASLVGLAVSPIISGLLGSTSIRAVFVVDALVLAALAVLVSRLMITAPLPVTESLPTEEI
jgi:MFS transporter, DHA1 family, multidrug resistance protein